MQEPYLKAENYLTCPYCDSKLSVEYKNSNLFGTAKCLCDNYPLVEGVLFLLKTNDFLNKRASDLVRDGRFFKAIWVLLSTSSRNHRVIVFVVYILHKVFKLKLPLKSLLYTISIVGPSRSWFNYLLKRSEKKDFVLLNTLVKSKKKRLVILDIGIGIASYYAQIPEKIKMSFRKYIGIDVSFLSLFIAALYNKDHKLRLICSDIEHGIPIRQKTADYLIIQDTFCQIKNKKTFINRVSNVLNKGCRIYIVGNLFEENSFTRYWGYGIKIDHLHNMLLKYFKNIRHLDPFKHNLTYIKKNEASPNDYALKATLK